MLSFIDIRATIFVAFLQCISFGWLMQSGFIRSGLRYVRKGTTLSPLRIVNSESYDDKVKVPKKRVFLPLPGSLGLSNFAPNSSIRPSIVRIQQFNVLADGLEQKS